MASTPGFYLFNALAVAAAATHKSPVMRPANDENIYLAESSTSTAAGNFVVEGNNLPDDAYEALVAAAAGADRAAKEAAVTGIANGWIPLPLLDLADLSIGVLLLATGAGVTFALPFQQPLPARIRVSYQHVANSGTITVTARMAKR